jgi:hypothetical protein
VDARRGLERAQAAGRCAIRPRGHGLSCACVCGVRAVRRARQHPDRRRAALRSLGALSGTAACARTKKCRHATLRPRLRRRWARAGSAADVKNGFIPPPNDVRPPRRLAAAPLGSAARTKNARVFAAAGRDDAVCRDRSIVGSDPAFDGALACGPGGAVGGAHKGRALHPERHAGRQRPAVPRPRPRPRRRAAGRVEYPAVLTARPTRRSPSR